MRLWIVIIRMFHHVFLLKRDVPLSNLLATSGGDVLCEPSRFAPEPSTALVSKDYNSVGVDGPSSMRRSAELGLIARDQIARAVQVRAKDENAHHHVHEIMLSSRCSIETEGALCRTSISGHRDGPFARFLLCRRAVDIDYSAKVYRASIASQILSRVSCGLRLLFCSICCTSSARSHPSRSLGSNVNNHPDEDGRATSLGQFLYFGLCKRKVARHASLFLFIDVKPFEKSE